MPKGSEALALEEKVRRREDYVRCYRRGRRLRGRSVTLFIAPNESGGARLGITASRKVGPAVVRNRIKRRIREVYRRWGQRSRLPATDLVVHVQPSARQATFGELRRELEKLLGRVIDRSERRPRPRSSRSERTSG